MDTIDDLSFTFTLDMLLDQETIQEDSMKGGNKTNLLLILPGYCLDVVGHATRSLDFGDCLSEPSSVHHFLCAVGKVSEWKVFHLTVLLLGWYDGPDDIRAILLKHMNFQLDQSVVVIGVKDAVGTCKQASLITHFLHTPKSGTFSLLHHCCPVHIKPRTPTLL